MADCTCHAVLKHIRHDGNFIGDDWKYKISVNGELKEIEGNGKDQEFTTPLAWTVNVGECGGHTVVSIHATALEEDLFFDDEGSAIRHVKQAAPAEGDGPVKVENVALRARVVEAIGWFSGGTNFVDFVFDLEYTCGS
jgi:hypothetical protein